MENQKVINIKLLFVPKFESGEMSGDEIGEAQLFYEKYCSPSITYTLRNGSTLYYNPSNGVAIGLANMGKTNATMFLSTLLSDNRFNFSNAYIMCVGCGGSSFGISTMGDVVIVRETVDYDQVFQSVKTFEDGSEIEWVEIGDVANVTHKILNQKLVEKVYNLTKDIELESTENTKRKLRNSFPGENWALRNPKVMTGTALTSDSYWKGKAENNKAIQLVEKYNCIEPFTISEMEDNSCAVVVDSFGLLDKLIVLRVSVNVVENIDGISIKETWGDQSSFADNVQRDNEETLDIFTPAMRNLFKVGEVIADKILSNELFIVDKEEK